VFCVLFLCSFLSPARLRAFQALSCSHLTSFAKKICSLWIRSYNAWPVGFLSNSSWICVLIRAFQSSTCRLKKTVSIRWGSPVVWSAPCRPVWGSQDVVVGSIFGKFFYGIWGLVLWLRVGDGSSNSLHDLMLTWVLRRAGPHTNDARSTWTFFSFSPSAKGQTTQTTPLIEAR